jgi:hypothetical protein
MSWGIPTGSAKSSAGDVSAMDPESWSFMPTWVEQKGRTKCIFSTVELALHPSFSAACIEKSNNFMHVPLASLSGKEGLKASSSFGSSCLDEVKVYNSQEKFPITSAVDPWQIWAPKLKQHLIGLSANSAN